MNPATHPLPVAPKPRTLLHGVILGSFCLGFGILLAITARVTKQDIALRSMEDRQVSLSQVIPDDIHDNNLLRDTVTIKDVHNREVTVYLARMKGKLAAVAYPISGTGYGGKIKLMLGVDTGGRILGVRVLSHHETPGMGDKIEVGKSNWILRFTGLSIGNPPLHLWKVKKDGGQFDDFAGATITPRAVVLAIRNGLEFFAANEARLTGRRK